MINFKRYFHSHFKANIKPLICILIAVLVLTFLIGINEQPDAYYDYQTGISTSYYKSTLYVPVIFLSILAYVLPVMEFSFFKKRINLDCAYSLPISRRCMGAVHYLTGIIILFISFTSSYILNFILLLTRGSGWFNFSPMIAHYFLCIILGFAMYSTMVFVFNEGNTMGDGIWFMLLYSFVLVVITSALEQITNLNIFIDTFAGIPWGTISIITESYQNLVELKSNRPFGYFDEPRYIFWFVFWIAAGIASCIGFFLTFGKRRMELTEEISDSYFGFRTLIPIYAISGMLTFQDTDVIIFCVIIQLLALLGYTIYRRGFHYKKSDIAFLLIALVCIFI